MGGIFDKVAPTEGQAGQEQEADISMDDLPLPQIPFDEIVPSESVFKALKDQKHVDIDPKACHEIVKLAVEAVNSVMNTEGPPGKEVNLLENDENLFELAAQSTANLIPIARLLTMPALPVALRIYDVAISRGDMDAEYDVLRIMASGKLGEEASAMALDKLAELAERGHVPSQYTYASHLASSESTRQDGWNRMRALADGGFPDAQAQVGHALLRGVADVLKADPDEAADYLDKASQKGHVHASFELSVLLLSGQIPKDPKRAASLLQKAASSGLPVAQHNLAAYYLSGLSDLDGSSIIEKDNIRAIEYFRMASAQRFPPSMMNLAKIFLEGTVVKRDVEQAQKLLESVATLGGQWGAEAKAGLELVEEAKAKGKKDGSCSVM